MKNPFRQCRVLMGVLLLGMAGCANTGERTGEYVDDSWITSKVKSEMVASKHISARNINVRTTQGVVTLTGTAATVQESYAAAEIAHGVAGVKGVENDIHLE